MNLFNKNIFLIPLVLLLGIGMISIDGTEENNLGTLTGNVVDKSSQEAVAGANVSVQNLNDNTSSETTTGEKGRFKFDNLSPGMYMVTAEAEEYEDWRKEVKITPKEKTLNIKLKPVEDDSTLNTAN